MTSAVSPNPLSFFPPKRLKPLNKPIFASSTQGSSPTDDEPGPTSDLTKLALAKAEAYKKAKSSAPVPVTDGDDKGNDDPVKFAMERAKEYKKSKGQIKNSEDMKVTKESLLTNKVKKKGEPNLSSIDFVGFEFSEKKRYRGLPPGLAPPTEPLLDGQLPEVELIVGDASKLEVTTPEQKNSELDSDNIDEYKPKVSTWGVFPRPSNISKTFGGGRTIQPGEVLETVEDKTAKQKRTRELIAAYKRKMGLSIDAKTKAECEKALKEGDNLMDLGELREALPYYEKVMKSVVFQSELHGLAALQWSICQDSLRRSSEARAMYEKLQSHPNVQVSKKARQFVFSFQKTKTTTALLRKNKVKLYWDKLFPISCFLYLPYSLCFLLL
ncbi:uncharacterized protein LOC109848526 isoform X2 [Asparagus officinalis]|uniref:uncharacterized protein LOC109848526 isoform X2 n=1 Tax=Asparagus officinalis TaxID=4686 RepID=UPI00098E180A|nr:uncharacterized protein LOC109848526 isoform X2 [Asparagus officinalis]